MADLLKLAERCEAATGPDRGLDRAISKLMFGRQARGGAQPYTASLDAAMTLVPEGWEWSLEAEETEMVWPTPSPWTYRCQMGHLIDREGATPALALCAAALRAREQS